MRCKYCQRELKDTKYKICFNCRIKEKQGHKLTKVELPPQFNYDLDKEAYLYKLNIDLVESGFLSKTLVNEIINELDNLNELYVDGARGNNKSFTILTILFYHFIHLKEYSFSFTRKFSSMGKGSVFQEIQKIYNYFNELKFEGCYLEHLDNGVLNFNSTEQIVEYLDKGAMLGATDNPSKFKGTSRGTKQIIKHIFHDEILEKPKDGTSDLAPEQQMENINTINMTIDRGENTTLTTMKSCYIYAFNADDPKSPIAQLFLSHIPTGNIYYRKELLELCASNEKYLENNPFISKIVEREVESVKIHKETKEIIKDENGMFVYEKQIWRTKFLQLSYLAAKPSTRTRDFYIKMASTKIENYDRYRKDYLGSWIINKEAGFVYWGMKQDITYKNLNDIKSFNIWAGLDPGLKDATAIVIGINYLENGRYYNGICYYREYNKITNAKDLQEKLLKETSSNDIIKKLINKRNTNTIYVYVDRSEGAFTDNLNADLKQYNITNLYFEQVKLPRYIEQISARTNSINQMFLSNNLIVINCDNKQELSWCELLMERFKLCKLNPTTEQRDERGGKNKLDGINALEYGMVDYYEY